MGLWNFVKGQLRSVIEWTTASDNKDALFEKWSDHGDEIKNASKLIVNPGQGCIFVYEGKVEAVLMDEGIVELKTANIPFWTTIKSFMQRFQSEHKVGIYFFRKTHVTDQKWGTPSVIKYDDPKYKFPVGLRAFGNYSFRVSDAGSFFVNFVGGNNDFSITQFKQMMNARIMEPLTDFMAECKYSYAEIDANRMELSAGIFQRLQPEFQKLGFEISDFRIEGTSFDDKTQERIDKIADATADAQAAAAVGLNFAQMQQLGAMRDAAKNEGGMAGMGMGMGAGMGFGQMMAGAMGQQFGPQGQPQQGQPQQQGGGDDPVAKLQKLKTMLDGGLITQDEYDAAKKNILSQM